MRWRLEKKKKARFSEREVRKEKGIHDIREEGQK